jgi:hypothetical protein
VAQPSSGHPIGANDGVTRKLVLQTSTHLPPGLLVAGAMVFRQVCTHDRAHARLPGGQRRRVSVDCAAASIDAHYTAREKKLYRELFPGVVHV